jgi:hypothetical protein
LAAIPVLNVSGEASYHRPYAHCVAKWLNQAGVKTEYVNLEDVGLPGNGHQMMSEKNSAGIAKFFMSWLDKNVHSSGRQKLTRCESCSKRGSE